MKFLPAPKAWGGGPLSVAEWWRALSQRSLRSRPLHHSLFGEWSPSPLLRSREDLQPVKLSPLASLSSSNREKLNSGFIRSSWRFRPSTIFCSPSLSAQYIGPPR